MLVLRDHAELALSEGVRRYRGYGEGRCREAGGGGDEAEEFHGGLLNCAV